MNTSDPTSARPERRVRALHYERIHGPHGEAVVCVAPERPMALMLDLLAHVDGPLVCLYLLLEDNGGAPPARYQSPVPVSRREVRQFCARFADFLEDDGRHALWIMDVRCEQRLIFDRHDLLFAYGRTDSFERVLVEHGYIPGRTVGRPAGHRPVDPSLDDEATRLHHWWPWLPVPLVPGDEF